jgi:gamma-glutamylcysteine synthetase
VLTALRRGIEKESLRVRPDGALATTPHPAALGSALTHPHITTDFSESQLELITGVHTSAQACLQELVEIHQFVYRALGDELMWAGSMPCRLPADDEIPIGALRHLQRRPGEDDLPHGAVASLRPAHADDFRHPLQLVAADPARQTTRSSA